MRTRAANVAAFGIFLRAKGRGRAVAARRGGQGCGVTALRFPVDVRLCLSQDIELLKMAAASAAAFVCALLKLVKIVKGLGGVRGEGVERCAPSPYR